MTWLKTIKGQTVKELENQDSYQISYSQKKKSYNNEKR